MKEDINQLLQIMARLRDPEIGCPWDVEQDFSTIAPHTIEEAYEVAEAINHGDMVALREELGDLLFQVVFHAQMARESGKFDFFDVVATISDKMVRRHPHVFGDAEIDDADAQTVAWEDIKAKERDMSGQAEGTLSDVPVAFPALTRANKLQKRAARVGFDWAEARQVVGKVREEIAEIEEELAGASDKHRLEEEIGDLLFSCVNLARKLGLDPETALRRGNGKFERRFQRMEQHLSESGEAITEVSLDKMMVFWKAIKAEETANG